MKASAILSLAAASLLATGTAVAQQGVTKDEISVATILALSGPAAAYSNQVLAGMRMRIAEINEQGGIHGRKIKLFVEDDGYDPKRAALAAQKLVSQDKVFIFVNQSGSAQNAAAMPVKLSKGIVNFMPLSFSREMYEPPNKYKWGFLASYYDQARLMGPRLFNEKKAQRACGFYQDDDFGTETMSGAEDGFKAEKIAFHEKASFKRGATDFSSQMARLKQANCDFVVLGSLLRETVGALIEARKIGFAPTFMTVASGYSEQVARLAGPAAEGLYAVMFSRVAYLDDSSEPVRRWANKYKTLFNEEPGVYSSFGYIGVDVLGRALNRAGPNLTTDSFIKAAEALHVPMDMFGTPELKFGPGKHLGSDKARLSQMQNGRWNVVLDYK